MEEIKEEVQVSNQGTDQGTSQTAQTTLEEFLATPEHKAAYDTAVSAAVKQALEQQRAAAEEEKRVAALSDQEKAAEREKALAEREARLAAAELKAEAVSKLAGAGMPAELAECLSYGSKEAYERSYTATATAFEKAVQAAVNDRLRGKTPPVVGQGDGAQAARSSAGSFAEIIAKNRVSR